MAYPQTPLPVTIEMYLGSSLGWVDITDYVFVRDGGISASSGFPDEGTLPEPSNMTMTLDNRDGRFTPRNPMSPYYGLIGRNTPVRVSVALYQEAFGTAVADGWGDDWTLDTTGGAAGDFDVAAGVGTIVVDGANEARAAYLASRSFTDIEVRTTIDIDDTDITGAAVGAGPILRVTDASNLYWCLVSVGTDEAVSVTVFDRTGGSNTQLATESTSITWDGTPLRVAFAAYGNLLKAKVWPSDEGEPRDWTLETTDTTHTSGSVGVRAAVVSGNTDTPVEFSFDDFEARSYRYHGEISEWPTRWDPSEQDVWTEVTAQGILRRLGQGKRPVRSPLRVAIAAISDVVAYWPCEDDGGGFASAILGQPPLSVTGTVGFAEVDHLVGSNSLPAFSATTAISGSLSAQFTDRWFFTWLISILAVPSTEVTLIEIFTTGGSADRWELKADSTTLTFTGYDASGSVVHTDTSTSSKLLGGNDQGWIGLQMFAVDATLAGLTTFDLSTTSVAGCQVSGGSIVAGSITGFRVPADAELDGVPMGHFAAFNAVTPDGVLIPNGPEPANAFDGETAAERAVRVTDNAGIEFTLTGTADDTALMGPQATPSSFIEALTECWQADMALMSETRHALGLTWRARRDLYNQLIALTLDYAGAGEIAPDLAPVDDDRYVRNDIELKRKNGSSYRAVDSTSRMGTQDPPDGVGPYEDQPEVNLYSDDQLPGQAHWRLHLGTWDEARYPRVVVNIAALAAAGKFDLIAAVCALKVGDRIRLTNLPAFAGTPGTVDLMVLGFQPERLVHPVEWEITLVCVPYGPYDIGTYGGPIPYGMLLTGTSGAYASTPDAASLDITGDIDIRADLHLADWTPSAASALVSKWGAAPNRSYLLNLNVDGTLGLAWSADGSAVTGNVSSTVAVPVTSVRLAVRATLDVDNGAGGKTVTFYTADTIDGSWTMLGSAVTSAGTTSIFAGNLPAEVGSHTGGTGSLLQGRVNAVEIRNGIAGTAVANPRFMDRADGTTSFADDAGRTWTVNGEGAIYRDGDVYRYDTGGCVTAAGLLLSGVTGAYASTPDAASLDITGDIDLRADVTLQDWTPAAVTSLVAKVTTASPANQRSYWLRLETDGTLSYLWSATGTGFTGQATSTVQVPHTASRLVVRVTHDVDNGASGNTVTFYTGETMDGPWTQLGSAVVNASGTGVTSIFAGTAPLEAGSVNVGTSPLAGVVHAVQVRNGINGTAVANPVFEDEANGTTSFSDDAGRTWTVNGTGVIYHDLAAGTGTTLLVSTSSGQSWTTAADELPMEVKCSGVVLTVTDVDGTGPAQVLTVSTTVVNGVAKTLAASESVSVIRPAVRAL